MTRKDGIIVKTQNEIEDIIEGGKKLSRVKNELKKSVKEGVSAKEIDDLAPELIEKEGGKASLTMFPG